MRVKNIVLIVCLWGSFAELEGQGYLNELSIKYGLGLPMGNYAGDNRDIQDVVGGMKIGSYWGVEFKSRLINIRPIRYGEYTFIDYLEKTGFFVAYDQFKADVSDNSRENLEHDNLEIFEIGKWKVHNLNFGLSTKEFISEEIAIMFKLGGGISEVYNPYITLLKNDELAYRRNQSKISTFGAIIGIDLMFNFDRVVVQLQSEINFSKPEIRTVTQDNVIGQLIPFNENSPLVIPKLSLNLGYSFLE